MAIKLADEIIKEMKNRQPAATTDASVDGEEYERWLYEEEKEKKDNNIYRIILLKGIAVNYTLFLISYSLL